jgi:hypothetical protein
MNNVTMYEEYILENLGSHETFMRNRRYYHIVNKDGYETR